MENNRIKKTSKNLDEAIIKIYYDKIILSSIIISKEEYYLIFSDDTMIEVIHSELNIDDIYKIILLIEEAKNIVHQVPASSDGLQKLLDKYFNQY